MSQLICDAPDIYDVLTNFVQRATEGVQRLSEELTIQTDLALGQAPAYALVTCSDSRIADTFDGRPGKIFIYRNIGNSLEDSADPMKLSQASEDYLTYAHHLGIPTLVIMGHGSCGCIVNACNCAKLPALPPDAGLEIRTLRRMGNSKRYIVDMVPEEDAPTFLSERNLPHDMPATSARLKALEIAHAMHMAKLAKEWLARLNSRMIVVIAHLDFATATFHYSLDGNKFEAIAPQPQPIVFRKGGIKAIAQANGMEPRL